MPQRKPWKMFGFTCFCLTILAYKPITRNLSTAVQGWRQDPIKMTTRIIVATIAGQWALWFIGHDQIGFFMKPLFRVGPGQSWSQKFYDRHIPKTHRVSVVLKAIEIGLDAGRMPAEGLLQARRGFVPDGLATAVTSPLWQFYETIEKLLGVVTHPERIDDTAALSLANIYGNLVRYAAIMFYWHYADDIYRLIGDPIEARLRQRFSSVG